MIGVMFVSFFFFKQKTAYEMRISDWSSDVCSSDLGLSDIRGRIGASSKVLGSAKSGHEDYLTYATNLVSTLEDVDVAVATTRLAQDEVQLQASYLALSRIGEMSLLSYLR